MSTKKKDELVNVRQAASQCGRNMETIRRWIWGGKLPAQKLGNQLFIKKSDLASFCRETATAEYRAESKSDLLERMRAFKNELKEKGFKPIDTTEMIHQMREERMNQIEQAIYGTETREYKTKVVPEEDFLERAIALQERIKARGGKPIDAAEEIRKIREERINELEQRLR